MAAIRSSAWRDVIKHALLRVRKRSWLVKLVRGHRLYRGAVPGAIQSKIEKRYRSAEKLRLKILSKRGTRAPRDKKQLGHAAWMYLY